MKTKIFVSYAHADMKPRPGFKDSRVSMILQDIEHELRCQDRRSEYEILRDAAGLLFAGDQLDEEISAAIDQAHIGLVLISRSYCRSEECRKELIQMIKKGKKLCLVEAENAWDSFYQEELKGAFPDLSRIIRSQFWESRDNLDVDFGWPLPTADEENSNEYYKAVRFTKHSFENMRHEILEEQKVDTLSQLENFQEQMVFIASPTGDVRREVERLGEALKAKGHSVFQFDHRRHLSEDSDAQRTLELICRKSHILVQLLGAVPGGKISDSDVRLVPLQNEVMMDSGKVHYVWEHPEVDRLECSDNYAAFLNSIQSHSSGYQEFERYVLKQVDRHAEEHDATARRDAVLQEQGDGEARHPFVGIDYAVQDKSIAEAVGNALAEHANVDVLPFDINSKQLERAVTDNDGIVMIYGNSSAGQKRTGAHFGIVQRFKNRKVDISLDVAIGNGLDEEAETLAPMVPRGPDVHEIEIDPSKPAIDKAALARFIDEVKNNATKRYE